MTGHESLETGTHEAPESEFAAEVGFPELPIDENPEDEDALRLILAGQRGLRLLYDVLEQVVKGERRFLVRMLRRDWQGRFDPLVAQGTALLSRATDSEVGAVEAQPSREAIEKLFDEQNGDSSMALARFVAAFADRAFLCASLVPWKSDASSVYEFFASSLEAEDLHLALILQLSGLLEDPPG